MSVALTKYGFNYAEMSCCKLYKSRFEIDQRLLQKALKCKLEINFVIFIAILMIVCGDKVFLRRCFIILRNRTDLVTRSELVLFQTIESTGYYNIVSKFEWNIKIFASNLA